MEILQQQVPYLPDNTRLKKPDFFLNILNRVKSIGLVATMEEYDRRKLSIFNQLNFFQLLTGILIPFIGLYNQKQLPGNAWVIASLPALVSLLVLCLNKFCKHEEALLAYFILYPVITCIVYLYGMNLGVNLFFILYGILSVFFLKDIGYMIFSLCLSMGSYFILSVILKHFEYQLESFNKGLFLFNQALAIVFIFYGLYLIKKESAVYQFHILEKNSALQQKNVQIQEQADKLKENATLLKNQTTELTELNALKNKLFSVISHDLKAPLYALRNLFRNIHQDDIPEAELKKIMPDVVNDLNYTVGLMDNLLLWAKTQMEVDAVHPQRVDIGRLISEVFHLLRLQSEAKHIRMENNSREGVYGYMDKDMMSLVLRNLLSNAIKFTPEKGSISVRVHEHPSFIEVYVQDSGMGIGNDALLKINNNDFYTTRGTASESGTGLGLMLCKEYLARNGGQLHIESEMGKGSVFSFSLPKPA